MESGKLSEHNGSCPRFGPKENCRIFYFHVARLRIKAKLTGSLIFITLSNFKIVKPLDFDIAQHWKILNMYIKYAFDTIRHSVLYKNDQLTE